MKLKIYILLVTGILVLGCVKNSNFDIPSPACTSEFITNATYGEVKGLYVDKTFEIQEDLIIEGYVVSSDEASNFFSVLHFQDSPTNPVEGFQIEIDVRNSHLFYPVGSKIYIKLKGLFLGKSKGVFKIGGAFTSFGNLSVGRLPATVVDQHIFRSCDEVYEIVPTQLTTADLSEKYTNTLVRLNDVEIVADELGEVFAREGEETQRTLKDCNTNRIGLLNSGFSDFRAEILPEGRGAISGVLLRKNMKYHLVIRSIMDIDFSQERCEEEAEITTSNQLFISELADPDNNARARFIELYNAANSNLSLNGWKIIRYTNASIEPSSEIDLSGHMIEAQGTFVISPNRTEFERVYGFTPDLSVGTNSPADSNGDDNMVIVDPFNKVVDSFGVIGEDGSNTNHEFEDGRAIRKVDVNEANEHYTVAEWMICNDTGDEGTIKRPKNAPEDFSPGSRN